MELPGRPSRLEPVNDPVELREREFLAAIAEADPDAPLQVFTRKVEGITVVAAEGELDLYTVDHFRKALVAALAGNADGLVLDFSYLTYLDSGGLALILRAAKALSGKLAVVAPGERVRRLLELTGLVRQLHLCRAVPEAVLSIKAMGAE